MTIEIKRHVPMPPECAHPGCVNRPEVGVNRRYVCNEHLSWALKPTREILTLAYKRPKA